MSQVSLKDAEADFPDLVEQATKGEFVTITRDEKPVAALVSIEAAEAARKLIRKSRPDFGDYLMRFPGGIDLERNPSRMRDQEF